MQTFLPYPDFAQSAKVLDNKRLGKQRVEAMQIIKALLDPEYGWQNHPAVKMWHFHGETLVWYADNIITEWVSRGNRDTCWEKIADILESYGRGMLDSYIKSKYMGSFILPPFIGNKEFHASHRSNLLRKDPDHYGQFGWKEPDDLPYIWLTQETNEQ